MSYKLVHEPKNKTYTYATEAEVLERLKWIHKETSYHIKRTDEREWTVSEADHDEEPE